MPMTAHKPSGGCIVVRTDRRTAGLCGIGHRQSRKRDAVEIVLVVIGAIAGIGVGGWIGLKWGVALMPREPWRYWLANLAMAIGGVLIATAGQFLAQWWISVVGLGFMGGGITGLKYGYGHSTGIWAIHDRLVGIDEEMRDD